MGSLWNHSLEQGLSPELSLCGSQTANSPHRIPNLFHSRQKPWISGCTFDPIWLCGVPGCLQQAGSNMFAPTLGPGTVQSTCCLELHSPRVESILCPSWSTRQWRSTSRRLSSKGSSNHPSWLWRSGITGWREKSFHSPSSPTKRTSCICGMPKDSIPVKHAGHSSSQDLISPSAIAAETIMWKPTPSHVSTALMYPLNQSQSSLQP